MTHGPILLAESGSSKTSWRLVLPTDVTALPETEGYNANVMSEQAMAQQLAADVATLNLRTQVDGVVFYGASFSTADHQGLLSRLLKQAFGVASVQIHHDLLGAARAVAATKPGTVAILGTGSNACRYDGAQITDQRGGHGYLLGDEGSGAHMGKQLMHLLLNDKLDQDVATALLTELGTDSISYRNAIYAHAKPNVALAGLTRFIESHREALKELIIGCFIDFLSLHVAPLLQEIGEPLHVVGSVGCAFRPEMEEACFMLDIPVPESYLVRPIEGLVGFHQANGLI
jgi:glucosamine kinase